MEDARAKALRAWLILNDRRKMSSSTMPKVTKPVCALSALSAGALAQVSYFTHVGAYFIGWNVLLLALGLSLASFALGIAAIGRKEGRLWAAWCGIALAAIVPAYLATVTR